MSGAARRNIALFVTLVAVTGCAQGISRSAAAPTPGFHPGVAPASRPAAAPGPGVPARSGTPGQAGATPGQVRVAFAGDVHFAERTAARLADPATAFGESAAVLSRADLTMVNLETAIGVGGRPEQKTFTFAVPPTAFTAMRDAGIDIATMANNHAADYGSAGLTQTLAAIRSSHFPVVGIGANAATAYAPYYSDINGVRLAIIAASQVRDETLAHFTATDSSPGIANAYSDRLVAAVRAAKRRADAVVVYVHWGTEYDSCPNPDQRTLSDALAAAGATAIVGTHAHVLQGAGWRTDGTYVAYGLGNYFWWRSFGNNQDDNGVLTLTISGKGVRAASFEPARLDDRGIGLPAVGATRQRVLAEWDRVRQCTGLTARPPA